MRIQGSLISEEVSEFEEEEQLKRRSVKKGEIEKKMSRNKKNSRVFIQ